MAGFRINTITVDGVALIARATATSQLIYTRVLSATAAMTEQKAGAAKVGDFDGAEGGILSVSAADDRAIIRGVIENQPWEITLKTFALCAKIDGDASDVVLAVQSDPDAAVTVPADTAPTVGVEVDFLITIADAPNVTVESIGPGTVSFGDLERFVSLHKAGDPTSGEYQTIQGAKTFSDRAHFSVGFTSGACNVDGILPSGTTSYIGQEGDAFHSGYFGYVYVDTVVPHVSSERTYLGEPEQPFYEAYATTVNATTVNATTVNATTVNGLIPYPTRPDSSVGATVTVPVGGIVAVFLESGHGLQDVTGGAFNVGSDEVHTCIFDDSTSLPRAGFYYIPAGKYVGLGGGSTVLNGKGFALLMRIA